MAHVHTDEPSVTELIKQLRDESTALFKQEVNLAKTEMSEKMSRLMRNLAYLLAGALVVFLGLIFLLRAISEGISLGLVVAGFEDMAPWMGPLIVGVIVSVIGFVLIQKAKSTLQDESLVPEKTVDSLKEDKQWLKQKAT